jgi:hypothetical protein
MTTHTADIDLATSDSLSPGACIVCASPDVAAQKAVIQRSRFAGFYIFPIILKRRMDVVYASFCARCAAKRTRQRIFWLIGHVVALFIVLNVVLGDPEAVRRAVDRAPPQAFLLAAIALYLAVRWWARQGELNWFGRFFGPVWATAYDGKARRYTVASRREIQVAVKPSQPDTATAPPAKRGFAWWKPLAGGVFAGAIGELLMKDAAESFTAGGNQRAAEVATLAGNALYAVGMAVGFVALLYGMLGNLKNRLKS